MALDRYAVVGNPIAHSRSPEIHALFAQQTGQALEYDKLLVEPMDFATEVNAFFANGGKGLNVTVPCKAEACRYADSLSEAARLSGSVNTLKREADGRISGDTTDGAGLVADLKRLGWSISDRRLLILGAGGAVSGVLAPLLAQKPATLAIANRTFSKAEALTLSHRHLGPVEALRVAELADAQWDLIINGTSASLTGALPALPEHWYPAGVLAYDMVYQAEPTSFMHWAQQQGAQAVSDGLGMLVGQAAESFRIWRGVLPDWEPVMARLRSQL